MLPAAMACMPRTAISAAVLLLMTTSLCGCCAVAPPPPSQDAYDFSWFSMNSSQHFFGDATFYGQQSGQDMGASCSFGPPLSDSLGLEWSAGVYSTIAMNAVQYGISQACGLCLQYRGLGQGLGGTPVSTAWKLGFVSNRCGECHDGDLDQDLAGDGRWKVEWYPVPCNVGNGTFRYDIGGKPVPNAWFMFTVSNTRVPIKGLEAWNSEQGQWVELRRGFPDNHFAADGSGYSFPLKVRITSVLGDVVYDTMPTTSGGSGGGQFPDHGIIGTSAAAQPGAQVEIAYPTDSSQGIAYALLPAPGAANATTNAAVPAQYTAAAPMSQDAVVSAQSVPVSDASVASAGRRLLRDQ